MFVFGHAGLTLGAALIIAGALPKKNRRTTGINEPEEQPRTSPMPAGSQRHPSAGPVSWLTSLAEYIDIRILLIGSLLPDIVDKSIGRFFFKDAFNNGRIFCHTLLFLIILAAGGLILYRTRRKTWLPVLAFGTFTHLVLDGMWTDLHTLLWPLYGFSFIKAPVSIWSWIESMLHYVMVHPWALIPEIVGFVIIVWFIWQLAWRRKFLSFLKYGRILDF